MIKFTEMEKWIIILTKRYVKENYENITSINDIMKFIDKIKIPDNVISEVIDNILNLANMTLQELIDDVNISYECLNLNIKNKQELIQYMKNNITTSIIMMRPLFKLTTWIDTKKGYDFYADINTTIWTNSKIRQHLVQILSKIKNE